MSDARFASGYVDRRGRVVAFDDLGEFLAAAAEEPGIIGVAFVSDLEDGGWVRAAGAFYVRIPALATPVGSGMAAFRDRSRAEAFARARGGGPVLDWKAAVGSHVLQAKGK